MSTYIEGTHGELLFAAKQRFDLKVSFVGPYSNACQWCAKRTALVELYLYINGEQIAAMQFCGVCSRKFHRKLEVFTEAREEVFKRRRVSGRWNSKAGDWRTDTELRQLNESKNRTPKRIKELDIR